MSEGLQIPPEKTGKLTTKHKILLRILGNFLIIIGKALKRVETYEQLNALGEEVSNRLDNAENVDVENLEDHQLEAALSSLNPPFLTYPGDANR